MTGLPTLFISHGSPDLILRDTPTRDFLRDLDGQVPRPRAVLSVSAHWETQTPAVDISQTPETIHDFRGFPDPLYEIRYRAPGAPDLAARAAELIEAAGLGPVARATRGLDHGAWVPMVLPWPEADIPICQLSIQPDRGPAHHHAIGRALAPLRDQGVLIMGSGNLNHNLQALFGEGWMQRAGEPTPDWVVEFRDWMATSVKRGDDEALIDYRNRAPHAVQNHPRDEHLLPLYVALGASTKGKPGRIIHASYDYTILAMDSYAFD